MKISKSKFRGWQNCYKLSNGLIDLIITSDFGPRILYCGLSGGENLFAELPGDPLEKPDQWFSLGGHRFWVAPEAVDRTYYADSHPVEVFRGEDFVRFTAPIEDSTGVQKEIEFQFARQATQVRVSHRVYNRGLWQIELAPWALSVMAPGGTAICPLPTRSPHGPRNLLPTSGIVQWSYTDMSDPRWTWGREFILLRQDAGFKSPQKVGIASYEGWAAYVNMGNLFLKTFAPQRSASYPDFGSTVEFFADKAFLEVETLGPSLSWSQERQPFMKRPGTYTGAFR